MYYYSTNDKSARVNFREATLSGQAPDKGLYFPCEIPKLRQTWIDSLNSRPREAIAFDVIRPYVGGTIPDRILQTIVTETVNFEIPLVPINDCVAALELFHGPTLAFKDVGARFMSRCLQYFTKALSKKITVLVATSGDTGSAVANGFYDVDGVDVVILYPSGKVSTIQEAQLTRLGKNIRTLEVQGDFDDCQRMVKAAFADADFSKQLGLTSANSINVARWLPQQFYYFFALQQWTDQKQKPVISVPSGNFGNICAGLLAAASGLPVRHFVAACNANDTVFRYLQEGTYSTQPTIATISNAMDVSDPSNFIRILELFAHRLPSLKQTLTAYCISDDETRATIRDVRLRYNYLLDPHGAVGYLALERYLKDYGGRGLFLETAHPVKFFDVIQPVIGEDVAVPEGLNELLRRPKESKVIPAEYEVLKEVLSSGF